MTMSKTTYLQHPSIKIQTRSPMKSHKQLKLKHPTATPMQIFQSVYPPILQRRSKLPRAKTTTHCCPKTPNLRKTRRPGPATRLASSILPSARPSSNSQMAHLSSSAVIFARATALGPTTSSTVVCVASSHTSVRSTMSNCPQRQFCSAALIVWCLRRKPNDS